MRLLIGLVTFAVFCAECWGEEAPHAIRAHYLVGLAESKVARAEDLLRRGAIWSARKHCVEAMELLASSQDRTQSDTHAQDLSLALQSLREAESFVVSVHDAPAVRRLIESHATPALKERNDRAVAAVYAHEAYLHFAATLIHRAMDHHSVSAIGSKATSLHGRAILMAKDSHAWHTIAVGKTLYEVAISLDSTNAFAHRELGVLLLEAGNPKAATPHLVKSSKFAPTRRGYEFLRKAAEAQNLIKVVAICDERLANGDYLQGIRVRALSAAEFAAMNSVSGMEPVRRGLGVQGASARATGREQKQVVTDRARVAAVPTWKKVLGLAH